MQIPYRTQAPTALPPARGRGLPGPAGGRPVARAELDLPRAPGNLYSLAAYPGNVSVGRRRSGRQGGLMSHPFTFRPGSCDEEVFRAVNGCNEYRLPQRFDPDDIIVDIG